MSTTGAGTSLRGISTRINGRHAFVHERVLELIARETKASGSVDFSKAELAERMGCCVRSLDRALTRLRREGLVVSTHVFNKVGGQLGNRYAATPEGIERAQRLARRGSKK
ncbi:MarR family transcriptional regulator [Enorma massiliensis]|uniref:MarR family transcriptional regulator n=1 Tax=Enorma massiliensis TaxID=1472761 RepID=UPI0034A4281D